MAALRLEDVTDGDTLGSGPVQARLTPRRVALLVAVGGAIGSLLRFVLAVLAPTVSTPTLVELPWSTLWANVLGCLALGVLTGALEVRPGRPWMQPLLGTGLCGGFTTTSMAVLEGAAMIGADFPTQAFTYALLTVFVCLGAVVGGIFAGRRLAHRAAARSDHAGRGRSRTAREGTPATQIDSGVVPSAPEVVPGADDVVPGETHAERSADDVDSEAPRPEQNARPEQSAPRPEQGASRPEQGAPRPEQGAPRSPEEES